MEAEETAPAISVRRSIHLFIHFHGQLFLDLGELLRGTVHITPGTGDEPVAVSLLTRGEHVLSLAALRVLAGLPASRWTPVAEAAARCAVDAELIRDLVRQGLLLSDAPEPELAVLRSRDEQLSSMPWETYAALFHRLSSWRGMIAPPLAADDQVEAGFAELIAEHGPPPAAFHEMPGAVARIDLPVLRQRGRLYQTLERRRTSRTFDPAVPLAHKHLAILLYYVFGCHGYAPLGAGGVALAKTSPSGGSLHPIEAYPLLLHVEDLAPGLYHYNVRDHALELLRPLESEAARDLAERFTAGQTYFRSAQALFLMTARFRRNFWKYQRHKKAYKVLLMDAGHLSQTFYLVCADVGLGAFFTAAVNDGDIEDELGLDGLEEGALAVCGCGAPSAAGDPLAPVFRPYLPRGIRPSRHSRR
jgi:putative peptide maturation dehydrogenase